MHFFFKKKKFYLEERNIRRWLVIGIITTKQNGKGTEGAMAHKSLNE
jgi:hypothetical protein